MLRPKRWPPEAWAPLLGGLCWLRMAGELGSVGFLLFVLPGGLQLASGASMVLYPGDLRISQFAAAGGALGTLLALPAAAVVGPLDALLLFVLSLASLLAAGWYSVRNEPSVAEVPAPRTSVALAAQVAIDEVILAGLALRSPLVDAPERVLWEVQQARQLFDERGWLTRPETYHRAPPPLHELSCVRTRVSSYDYEHLQFASEYEPDADEPGRDRWLDYAPNRTAHAWIFRQPALPGAAELPEERRPWLVCVHGYEMGIPRLDFAAFRVLELFPNGVNVCLPVLPLHGPRRVGRRSGAGFLAGDFLDTIHAEAQAMWDVRRLLSWIRAQACGPIGIYGLSLGGYNAALLAALESDLACVIAGIPAVDFSGLTWRHGPTTQLRYAEHHGLAQSQVREVMEVISPLAMPVLVPREQLYIFAGVADRLVPAEQPRDLWEHWGRPRIEWYQGAHLTFRAHRNVARLWSEALRDSGLLLNR